MKNEPMLEQWYELYNLGLKIGEMKPWNKFNNLDIITIEIPNKKEPCFCSFLGAGGQCFGVNTFIGHEGLRNFLSISDEESYIPLKYIMVEQINLACFFGNKDIIPIDQLKIINKINIEFKEKNKWIYFQSFKKGQIPSTINAEEAEILLICLKELIEVIKDYEKLSMNFNFHAGDVLVRRLNKKIGKWQTIKSNLREYLYDYPTLVLTDEILAAKLKRKPRVENILEYDMIYTSFTIGDESYDRPVRPKFILLVNHYEGIIIGRQILLPNSDEIQGIIEIIINYIMEYGRPMEIYIRNPFIENILKHLCDICCIKLTMKKSLEIVDEFARSSEILEF